MEWMPHRKRKETKQPPGTAWPGNILGCCLVSLRFLCHIHSIHSVYIYVYICNFRKSFKRMTGQCLKSVSAYVTECLINEDCPDTDYCDPNTRSCTDACNLDGKWNTVHPRCKVRNFVRQKLTLQAGLPSVASDHFY